MLLTIAPFGEFTKLFQVMLLIILPVLAFSLLATVLLHYGRKRRRKDHQPDEEKLHSYVAGSSPENFCYKTNDGHFVYLDHTGLLREYREKLSYSQARYMALRQDFIKLESGINGHVRPASLPDHFKKNTMEHNTIQQPNSVDDNATAATSPNNEPNAQDYLNDLLAEKKKQIEFLQNQIDLRIKSYHYAEKEKEELRLKWEQAEQTRVVVEEERVNLQSSLEEKQGRVTELEQTLQSQQDQVVYLESLLQEMKTQNKVLDAAAADAAELNRSLKEDLQTAEARAMTAEQKLLANKRVLQRLFSEFSNCLEEEAAPPVIALHPDYSNSNEWPERTSLGEGTAAQ